VYTLLEYLSIIIYYNDTYNYIVFSDLA
jgi:hypothetical protein